MLLSFKRSGINMKRLTSLVFLFLLSFGADIDAAGSASGEDSVGKVPIRIDLQGYISDLSSVMFENPGATWLTDNVFHNRLNFYFHYGSKINAGIQLRNRFIYGQIYTLFGDYYRSAGEETNYLDLSVNLPESEGFMFQSQADRFYFQYNPGKLSLTIGRQRINWGQTLIWNPNDIFNVQNAFDFDYIEKPGSDAIRLQFYPNYTSTFEIATKADYKGKLTAALYYRFTKWNYDFQLLGGFLSEEDVFGGVGWAGDLKGAGFRGEASWFRPVEDFSGQSGQWLVSVSLDYTFSNSLYLQFEGLFNQKQTGRNKLSFYDYYRGNLDVRQQSFSTWNYFLSGSFPVTPLLNLSLSGIFYPEIKAVYLGPSAEYSLKENAEISFVVQLFDGEFDNPIHINSTSSRNSLFTGFLRYKFSF